jgi:hypothetical protein
LVVVVGVSAIHRVVWHRFNPISRSGVYRHKGKINMSQNEALLQHFRAAGSITMREALLDHGIQCLTKRIQELRESGYKIISERKNHPITGQRYTRYRLKGVRK